MQPVIKFDASGNCVGSNIYYDAVPDPLPPNEIACTEAQAQNPAAWKVSNGALVSVPPTLAQQAQALLDGGFQVTSTSTPAINGTYPCDATTQQQINAEITSLLLNGTFTDGTTSLVWSDKSGAEHIFEVTQFKAFATRLAAFVTGCVKATKGRATGLPVQPATIP